MAFCKEVCPWAVRQAKQASTWRGLAIAVGTLVAVVNPVLGASVIKAVGLAVGAIDILKNDNK